MRHISDITKMSNYLSPSWVQTKIEEISLPASLTYPKRRYIMIGCFILGSGASFNLQIGEYKDFTELSKVLWEENQDHFVDAGVINELNLKLWNVEISTRNNEKYSKLKKDPRVDIDIKQEFGGEEIDQTWLISRTFPITPSAEHIHIIVQPLKLTTTMPFAKTISIAQIEKEVQDLFKFHSQDLEKVATNKYDPYIYLEAPYDHPYKSEIDEKKIPMFGGNPNLLLYNLPGKNEDCLTNCKDLEADLKRNIVSSSMTVVMGTSGCGKTRLCLELLCRNYGLYFVAVPLTFGGKDLETASDWTKDEIHGKEPAEAKKIAGQAVWSCITARLVMLDHLLVMAEKLKYTMEPKSWLVFQLNHQLVNMLPIKFRNMDAIALSEYCFGIIESIDNKIGNIFPIIYDEAQYHTTYLLNTFPSYNDEDKKRPFFTVVTKTFLNLTKKFAKTIICITGTGLSLMEAKDLALSNVAKEETAIPIFKNFGQIETSEEILQLARNIFPLEDKYASMAIKLLKGRYRFTWTWIHYLLNSYDPEEQLEILKKRLTTNYIDPRNPRYSLYSGLVELVRHPNERHSYINHESILELIKRAIIYYSMTGRGFVYKNNKEIDIMSIGFAHLETTRELTGIIDEPLVIQAGINYFINNKIDNMWFDVMSQVNFNASMPGFIWEKCVTNFLHDIIFKSNMPLSSHEKLFPNKSFRYLPDDFKNSPELLPSGKNRVGMISVELSAPKEYIKWLSIVSLWEKKGKVSDGFCPICYPPNTAGPDISIAFFFPEGGKREAYILNVQVKLRNNVELKKVCKTVDPETMFTDKDLKPSSSHNELHKIYKEQGWDNRNIRMIIAYPCNFKRKRDYQKTPGASKKARKIPRLIIDENNADALISNDCQNWVKVLKQEQGSTVDWECSDIENSEDEEYEE